MPIKKKKGKKKVGKKTGNKKCKLCGSARGVIRMYRLFICRRCFREVVESIGFKKF